MGSRIRAVVTVLLTLISLSVLSLHVALCFHYPSALFAVTLLLNPSLWLFVGLLSMFCTLVLSYRDKRRKLVPALCTSCRPKKEASRLATRGTRFDPNRYYQHPSCKCAERSLVTCHYSSDSSVHTTTQLLSKKSITSQTSDVETKGSLSDTVVHDETESLLSFDDSASKKPQLEDVQNYSCLMKTFSVTESKGNTLVVIGKTGDPQNLYFDKDTLKMLPSTHQCLTPCPESSHKSQEEYNSGGIKAAVVIHNEKLSLDLDKIDSISETSSSLNADSSDHLSSKHSDSPLKDYSLYRTRTRIIPPRNPHSDTEWKPLIRNRCTCPRGYFTNYGAYNTHFPIITKSNKPIMKCTKTLRTNTPTHLFQVKQPKEEEVNIGGNDSDMEKSVQPKSKKISIEKKVIDMTREPDTFSSIVSLFD